MINIRTYVNESPVTLARTRSDTHKNTHTHKHKHPHTFAMGALCKTTFKPHT